eukprot:TRINITY_DN13207_c0_g1_i1.p3 TRINITY_DN13207_c0_g1~~TRINITY_DN13207_c0_g1_i1.p3  ORF type:complete len:106 (+),score=3.04 TRINITY_DN13207_c0_g1_i1:561-878(+)
MRSSTRARFKVSCELLLWLTHKHTHTPLVSVACDGCNHRAHAAPATTSIALPGTGDQPRFSSAVVEESRESNVVKRQKLIFCAQSLESIQFLSRAATEKRMERLA